MKEKTKVVYLIIIAALSVTVLLTSVAFALLSQQLTINGNAVINPAKWDVQFTDYSVTTTLNGSVTRNPSLGTSFGRFEVELTKPGDYVTFDITVENKGQIDATLTEVLMNTPEFMGENGYYDLDEPVDFDFDLDDDVDDDISDDPVLVDPAGDLFRNNDWFEYTFTNLDGSAIATTGNDAILRAGDTKHFKLVVGFKENATQQPTEKVRVSGLGISLLYQQYNG